MYLKSIRAFGFKSFADKIDLELKPGIIGIVGPNGSGKSNIVDAVKWVLGESSSKNLRGANKMTDVIFSGSKTRDAHTKASVTLTFDNEDHYLNCDFKEIAIKRVLYNSGENEYYLNNSRVRLKDIIDLFLDSGASKETFNIISQGSVQNIINMHPYERRNVFEEAAGVLKYKKRKEESIRKLDKTSDNLSRINLIIKELKETVEPLKAQSETAEKFLAFQDELKNLEISLIAKDITDINDKYQKLLKEKEELNNVILDLEVNSKKDNSNIERMKLTNLKLEEKLRDLNQKLLQVTDEMFKLESEKQIALERKKYSVSDQKLETNITNLKEEELNLKNNMELVSEEIKDLTKKQTKIVKDCETLEEESKNLKIKRNTYLVNYNEENKNINDLKNKINLLENNALTDSRLSYAIKNVLNNPRLKGIHNVLGKLIDVSSEYSIAIETALGFNQNVIVVDNEASAKAAINYLKDNSLGRATFFPLSVIKAKYVDSDSLYKVQNHPGFISVASDLVSYDKLYENIVLNQLGNVLVVKDIDSLNAIGKIINYRYRIVSLDGEILHTGGSITGGKTKQVGGIISERNNLVTYQKELEVLTTKIKETEKNIRSLNDEITIVDQKIEEVVREKLVLEEKINLKTTSYNEYKKNYDLKLAEIKGTKDLKGNKIDSEIDKLLENYYAKVQEKELLEKDIAVLNKEKSELLDSINEEEADYKEFNSEYNKKLNNLKDIEISLGKMDVKLDNLLINLNENYQMTYENAKDNYVLEIEEELARMKVNSLKHEIKALGMVNTGAISEYERLNKRYTFLTNQAEDLTNSINNLTEVITEMDEIMVEKFATTFNQIKTEFNKIYKIIFKGGSGVLELTDPDNMLETGIEIKASPPGKKLKSIGLLSGGEKALTSLSLLFAILNVKPAPFCILDEVEDALDEANVDIFGKYINAIKNKTQFIIITHKKRTMEYADVLYGITMQESGVSKLVSVKLDNL